MSLAATSIAFTQQLAKPLQKLALIYLADFADENGVAPVAWADAALFCGCTEAKLAEAFDALEKAGLIKAVSPERFQILGVAP